MDIEVRINAVISIEDGETNINEILWAIGQWNREVGVKVAEGVINTYQARIVELLCAGRGQSSWVPHEGGRVKGQLCLGGGYRPGGTRGDRGLRTELGDLSLHTPQIVCRMCERRFRVLNPLLKIEPRSKPTIRLKHMTAETMTDLSYRKGSSRLVGLAQVEVSKSSAHRWMTTERWEGLGETAFSPARWESFSGLLTDGTGYKRQGADSTKGQLRLVMGMSDEPHRLVPLGVWVDKSWEEIDRELLAKRPEGIKPPVVVMDGERGQEVLGNLAQDIQRCQWHTSHQMGYFLWRDGAKKSERTPFVEKLAGLMKIDLPVGEYQAISEGMKEQIQEQLSLNRQAMDTLIQTFQGRGYHEAAAYLRNATTHTFTVIEKWLEFGYMPPKVISLLERVMRELGRRIKKIGASWKEKGLLAVARVLLMRIYNPEEWKRYWQNLLDLQGRCTVKSYTVQCSLA